MDSTLGKILASIVGLIALAAVVVYGVTGFEGSRTTSAVSDVATLATQIHATYANNPAGYTTLTNQVAVAAGDVPADMLKGSSIVSAWGQAVTLAPVAGQPKDFAINLGAVPRKACVQLLTDDASLMGAAVGGKQVPLPVDPSKAASLCATSATGQRVSLSVQYGQVVVPTCTPGSATYATPGDYTASVPGTCSKLTIMAWGAGGGGGGGNMEGMAGNFVEAQMPLSGDTTVSIVVGQPGSTGGGVGLYGGGGAGGAANAGSGDGSAGGSGGGYSMVTSSSGAILLVAGGGGGGGGANSSSGPGDGQNGSLTAGGAAGVGESGCPAATAGSYLQGGNGGEEGGGGGGGYYGGGGGGSVYFIVSCNGGDWAGNGSNFVANSLSTLDSVVATSASPPNPAGYAALGSNAVGLMPTWTPPTGDGLVVLSWSN